MPRPAAWFVFVFGMVCVAYGPADTTAQQKVDPKQPPKVDPKQPPKTEPKAQPKPPDPKAQPKPPEPKVQPQPEPTEPEPPAIDGPPSPLELVRGLRQEGQSDLAIELIGELEQKANTPAAVKAELPLERARCLLEAADDEPDEAARLSLVGDAKDGFATFLRQTPGHPRAAEAYLALARLTALEAKAQLAKARRIDVPPEGDPDRDAELTKQKAEAAAARPLFLGAAKQFKSAADKIGSQLAGGGVDAATRRALVQSKVDAELASAVNQMYLGDTYIAATADEKKERSKSIDQAAVEFKALINGKDVPMRVNWVAKAWIAECDFQKDSNAEAEKKFQEVLKAVGGDSDDGKRVARFFQIRHKVLEGEDATVEKDSRAWLSQYGSNRRAAGEAVAVRWYLATVRQRAGDKIVAANTPKGAKAPTTTPPTAMPAYREAEKLYRVISQSDNEFTYRAQKRRMYVVRRLLGEAEGKLTDYKTFEDAQMASLIQISKLMDEERATPAVGPEKLRDRRNKIVSLLEHAREIATEKDNPADVTEVLIRLIYFYRETDQAPRAAVLGEYVARQVRGTGGKSSAGGALGVSSYTRAAGQIRVTEAAAAAAARQADRDRAIRLARFLDERFPNDTATDSARHQLAGLLYEDGKTVDAYDATLKVRPGYDRLTYLRLFQGAVATQLLTGKDSPLPEARRTDVFRRSVADLEKLPPPPATASEDDARTFIAVRSRLAFLYLLQNRVDAEAEKAEAGFAKAARIAEEASKSVGTYKSLMQAGDKGPTLDGWEAYLTAEDSRTRAVYLEGLALFAAAKYDEVFNSAGKVLQEMNDKGRLAEQVQVVAKLQSPEDEEKMPDPDRAQKVKVGKLAEGVDKLRRDLVVVGLKTRVQLGQGDNSKQLFELLKKYGGSIEANQQMLENLTLEMGGRIEALRKAGKAPEAQALSGAFGSLIEEIAKEPNLPPPMQLFLGQALVVVGEYEKAVNALKNITRPATLAPPAEDLEARAAVSRYRRAALDTARAYRLGKKFPDAEKHLADVMGNKDKQGWAYSSLDFRKEACYLAEARGANEKDVKEANKQWGTAVKGWRELENLARARLAAPPPKKKNADGMDVVDDAAVSKYKNDYYDAYFDTTRCVLKANMQLLGTDAGKVQQKVDDTAKRFADLEKAAGTDMTSAVRNRYHELIAEVPALRKSYEAAGGKLFLQAAEN